MSPAAIPGTPGSCILIGSLVLLFLFLGGICGNTLAVSYFIKRARKHLFPRIFCVISLTDLLTSLLTFAVGLSYLLDREPGLFAQPLFREVWGSLWNFSSRYSVYLVALMSITRTIRIVFPFSELRGHLLNLGLLLYVAFLLATTPAFHHVPHYYKREWCALALNKSSFSGAAQHSTKYYLVVMSIPSLLTVSLPISIVSTAICVYKILHKRRQRSTTSDHATYSAVTMVIFTIIYIILNIPYCVIYLYVQIESQRRAIPPFKVIMNPWVKAYVAGFTHILSISLNALINPILYYWRMKDFRKHFNSVVMRQPYTDSSTRDSSEGASANRNIVSINMNRIVTKEFRTTASMNASCDT